MWSHDDDHCYDSCYDFVVDRVVVRLDRSHCDAYAGLIQFSALWNRVFPCRIGLGSQDEERPWFEENLLDGLCAVVT